MPEVQNVCLLAGGVSLAWNFYLVPFLLKLWKIIMNKIIFIELYPLYWLLLKDLFNCLPF